MGGMKVTKRFKSDFEIVADRYGLLDGFDRTEYNEFKVIVRKMLEDHPEFTVKWITNMAIGYGTIKKIGVIPYTGGTPSLQESKHGVHKGEALFGSFAQNQKS